MNTTIDPILHDEVRPILEGGEGLLWAGRPEPYRAVRAKIRQALFGVAFILLFFLVYVSGLPAHDPYFGAASAPFTLLPAVLSIGSLLILSGALLPLFAYRTAKKTVYAVTDRRVLALTRGRSARMVRHEDMLVPLLDLRPDGRGDIHFNGRPFADGTENQLQFSHFLGVEAAGNVYQLLLGRTPGLGNSSTAYRAVQDYLELLLQGKRTLDEDLPRE